MTHSVVFRFRVLWAMSLAAGLALTTLPLGLAQAPWNTAIVPAPELENDSYDWYARHEAVLKITDSRIILMGVLPRGAKSDDPFRSKILELNKLLAEVAKTPGVTFLDIGERYLLPSGELPRKLMSDYCHPTEEGYAIWAAALRPLLQP